MACHKIPTVANFWIDFGKGNKILLLFLRRTQLHFSQGASERSPEAAEQMNRARRTACTKLSYLGEPHQVSGRAEEHGPAAKG
jgi:hypothetical protein